MNRRWLFPVWKIPLVEKLLEDKILKGHVCTSLNAAKKKVIGEYQEFNKNQKLVFNFYKEIRKIKEDRNGKNNNKLKLRV